MANSTILITGALTGIGATCADYPAATAADVGRPVA